MRLAFFDSGIGGLTVLRRAMAALPHDEFIYYADTSHAPYGVKPKADVSARVLDAAGFLARLGIDALVVACNTATAVAIQTLRERFSFPVIGMEPAIKPALARNEGRKVLVAATSLTLRESKLETLIANLGAGHQVERLGLDALVTYAERFEFDTPAVRDYLAAKLTPVRWEQYGAVVLGCTHFIFYRDAIQDTAGGQVAILDGNEGTVNQLVRVLAPLRSSGAVTGVAPRVTFYTSGVAETQERVVRMMALLKERRTL